MKRRPLRVREAGQSGKGVAIRIRRVERSDVARLESLWRDIDEQHQSLWPRFFQSARDGRRGASLAAAAQSADELLLLAETDERVLGFVRAQVYDTPDEPSLVRARRMKVEELAVAVGARRKGVGGRLLRQAIAWAGEQGAVEAVLVVWEGNSGAERFYRAAGFRPLHRVLARVIERPASAR